MPGKRLLRSEERGRSRRPRGDGLPDRLHRQAGCQPGHHGPLVRRHVRTAAGGHQHADEEASQAAYDRYAAPTPARVLFQGGFAAVTPHAVTTFDFADDDRAPLLFISGGSDHILPPVVQDHNYKKCAKHSAAIAAHKVFPGRDHYTCGEPGWEAVADFALDWALAPVAGELE